MYFHLVEIVYISFSCKFYSWYTDFNVIWIHKKQDELYCFNTGSTGKHFPHLPIHRNEPYIKGPCARCWLFHINDHLLLEFVWKGWNSWSTSWGWTLMACRSSGSTSSVLVKVEKRWHFPWVYTYSQLLQNCKNACTWSGRVARWFKSIPSNINYVVYSECT